ncbi:MAG: tripartite tricarboxylate transporter TctB family protein [Gammaproteobacteria bacterium]|nr:tripartite tricarboxylate transporter TctB family protein [Gammaproteobacteria bacterium]MBT8436362.1 tripartite tricarboxylate transporter TctB family protein [Gammaproteobacteria bacterium]
MTVRTAELLMAILMGVFSIYLMVKSAELPIGWIEEEGPGGGTWPFWLSTIMLISCGGILYNWLRKKGSVATSNKTYIEAHVLGDVAAVAGALIVTVALFSFVGVYGALPLFLIFYIRFLGKHSWGLTAALTVGIPVVTFYFFEITLKIILPKGITEPLFLPLYKIFL